MKSPFMIYAYFESILMPDTEGKQNPDESYTDKYQKQIVCSYRHRLVCVDDNFTKLFMSHLGEDTV